MWKKQFKILLQNTVTFKYIYFIFIKLVEINKTSPHFIISLEYQESSQPPSIPVGKESAIPQCSQAQHRHDLMLLPTK